MKTMHMRDFLRGGYKDITEPTQITKHGRQVATWVPFGYSWTTPQAYDKSTDPWQPKPGERVAWEE